MFKANLGKNNTLLYLFSTIAILTSCDRKPAGNGFMDSNDTIAIEPLFITDTVPNDSDDPAIWINHEDPSLSLVIGTDKDENGGLYVFDLEGKMDKSRSVTGLNRPNNVDVEYGLMLGGKPVDIAVATERFTHKLRIYSLPAMQPIDNGGIPVFEGQEQAGFRDLMGISLYKSADGKIYAIVGRKTGPVDSTYLWQYLLYDDGNARVAAKLVRKFGQYSGLKEIEAIAVDDQLGYVYYSDEGVGVRKYYADPGKGNQELSLIANDGITDDNEGLSIYNLTDSTGFILLSDQQAGKFQVFRREGEPGSPHQHKIIKIVKVAARESDGSEAVAVPLGKDFPRGLFVAMSDDRTFHYYQPEKILGDSLLNSQR